MEEMEDRWLSVDETGKTLVVCSDSGYGRIDKHAIPVHRKERASKLEEDKVEAWAEAVIATNRNKKGSGEWRSSTTSIFLGDDLKASIHPKAKYRGGIGY